MKFSLLAFLAISMWALGGMAQVPPSVQIQIIKAEDARRYDRSIEDLLKSPSEHVRARAALAAGRIGNDSAVPKLSELLQRDASARVRTTAAFALGEIESITAADAILNSLSSDTSTATSRLTEAAGKIAAANATHAKASELREAILDVLEAEARKGAKQDRETILLGITAALRAAPTDAKRERPDDTDTVLAKFITNLDARVRADAANALARLRAKNATDALRTMLLSDDEPIARANAARALGAADDKTAVNMLIDAATEDDDSRVRVSAIRALAT